MNFLKNFFHAPDAQAMALTELAEAQREQLQWQTAKEYANRMVEYQNDRIARLTRLTRGNKEGS